MDYKFYNQLEQILGQEAISIDEYDERDEHADQEPGHAIVIYTFALLETLSATVPMCVYL